VLIQEEQEESAVIDYPCYEFVAAFYGMNMSYRKRRPGLWGQAYETRCKGETTC